jgi:sucrose phosphorylase
METGEKRAINRARFRDEQLRALIIDEETEIGSIFSQYTDLLMKRATIKAFHPDADQKVFQLDPRLFTFRREAKSRGSVVCVHNISSQSVTIDCRSVVTTGVDMFRDFITGKEFGLQLVVEPYGFYWLEERRRG